MGFSQARLAATPSTLRNWEQGRARPDTPTRVLPAVIAKHPEAVEGELPQGYTPKFVIPISPITASA